MTARLHPAGIRAFTYEKADLATVAQLQGFYDQGYDVLSANAAARAVQARIAVNQARGVTPP